MDDSERDTETEEWKDELDNFVPSTGYWVLYLLCVLCSVEREPSAFSPQVVHSSAMAGAKILAPGRYKADLAIY